MVMAPSAIYDSHDEYANSFYPDDTKSVNHGPEILSARDASKQLIRSLLYETATSVDTHTCLPGDEDPFFVADLGEIYRQHVRWKKNLPRVKPFYGEFGHASIGWLSSIANEYMQLSNAIRSPACCS